jgi:hypothetical protein
MRFSKTPSRLFQSTIRIPKSKGACQSSRGIDDDTRAPALREQAEDAAIPEPYLS